MEGQKSFWSDDSILGYLIFKIWKPVNNIRRSVTPVTIFVFEWIWRVEKIKTDLGLNIRDSRWSAGASVHVRGRNDMRLPYSFCVLKERRGIRLSERIYYVLFRLRSALSAKMEEKVVIVSNCYHYNFLLRGEERKFTKCVAKNFAIKNCHWLPHSVILAAPPVR